MTNDELGIYGDIFETISNINIVVYILIILGILFLGIIFILLKNYFFVKMIKKAVKEVIREELKDNNLIKSEVKIAPIIEKKDDTPTL